MRLKWINLKHVLTFAAVLPIIVPFFCKILYDERLIQQQQQLHQQQYFSIFNNSKSILLALPQTIKKPRASNIGKKNSTALQF